MERASLGFNDGYRVPMFPDLLFFWEELAPTFHSSLLFVQTYTPTLHLQQGHFETLQFWDKQSFLGVAMLQHVTAVSLNEANHVGQI